MKRTSQVFLLCLCALIAGVAMAPTEAHALDLQLPIQLDFQYDSVTRKNQEGTANERSTGQMEFGLQLPLVFKFHPKFGVGPAFRFAYNSVSFGSDNNGTTSESTSSQYLIGLGVMIRSDVHEMFTIQLGGYYDLGAQSTDDGDSTTPAQPDTDLSGFEVRLDLLARAKIGQYKTWFELGPYFYFRSLTEETTVSAGGTSVTSKVDHSGFGLGLALQGTFEFGI